MMSKIIKMTPIIQHTSWIVDSDGFYINFVIEQMKKEGYPEDSIRAINSNAVEVLSQCPNPYKREVNSKTGIIIGKVQSGKTSNFISLIAMAFDNEYKISIVFGGNKNNLLDQNVSRIKTYLNIDPMKVVILDTNKNSDVLNSNDIYEFISQGRKVIIIGLKHQKHIDTISGIFDNYRMRDMPTIIIDDEGDQATLNTKKYDKQSKDKMSTIYTSVSNLKSKLSMHCFLSVTATPQANILIDTVDFLSPDFGVLVYPGIGYCGLADFHGLDEDKYVKVISENEISLLDGHSIPSSVYEAMASFFVSNAVRNYRGDYGNHAILFHPSEKKVDHKSVVYKIQTILDEWKHKIIIDDDISYIKLKNILYKSYLDYKKDGVQLPKFDDLEIYIKDSIRLCSKVHECNSDTDASSNSELYKTNIFVGGNMVERGLTIKGLAITYIIRRSKSKSNIDNTEQRARWFGYKKEYFDLCRIFTTKQIKNDFKHIYEHDEALWDTIEKAQDSGVEFKDIGRLFLNNSKLLRLTRRNVARTEKLDFDSFKSQNSIVLDEHTANYNNNLIRNYLHNLEGKSFIQEYTINQIHKIYEGLKFSEVKNNIFDKYVYNPKSNINKETFRQLETIFNLNNIEPVLDIIMVRFSKKETRTIDINGLISSGLMQGATPDHNTKNYYIGDRKISDRNPNRIQVQIHMVKPINLVSYKFYSPAFVIYLPPKIVQLVSGYDVRSE